jgi:DNA-binding NtrC family response regulator
MVLTLLAEMLKRLGHEVVPVTSGQQAIACLEAEKFDAVISDIFMPDGTGIEVLVSIRAKQLDVPFICITGGDGTVFTPYANTMVSLGAMAVLQKPFNSARLEAALAGFKIGVTQ